MKSLFDLDPASREYLDRMNLIENLVWDIAKIVYPSHFIEPDAVARAKEKVLSVLKAASGR